MPRSSSWTSRGGVRTALLVLMSGLGVAALCLVVFGTSQKQLQLGVLLGLWSALIAACLLFNPRAGQPDAEPVRELADARVRATELHEAQLKVVALQQEQLEAARQAYFSQEIELRRFSEQQLARDAGSWQDSPHQLEVALGREVERVLLDQLGSLRAEVAALRAEVVEKLGGQLRLERIETTRVIGSDLEALQHEIRRLAAASSDSIAAPARAGEAPVRPQPDGSRDIVDAELVEFPPPATELPAVPASRPERPAPAGAADEQPAGRRRAPEPERLADDPRYDDPRYQGRRRADGPPADWFASSDG